MWAHSNQQDITTFLQRIDSTVITGRNPRAAWIEFLKKNGGGSGGNISDLELNYLNTRLSMPGKSKNDAINHYLSSKGYDGSIGDKVRFYLKQSATK